MLLVACPLLKMQWVGIAPAGMRVPAAAIFAAAWTICLPGYSTYRGAPSIKDCVTAA